MKPNIVLGIVLLVIGAFLLIRGGTFTTRRDVVKLGDVKISADEEHSIAPWIGGLVMLGGVGAIAVGAGKGR